MNTPMILDALAAVHRAILANESHIESLDRAIGDGDHFINVKRGCEVLAQERDALAALPPGAALTAIGMKLLVTIGGASGPLLASFFLAAGKTIGDKQECDGRQFAAAFANGVDAIKHRGKADVGEKTMLDVLIPVSRLLVELSGTDTPLSTQCVRVTAEASHGMLATRDMIATKGRASFLGERAIGHVDPGSKTCEIVIGAVCDVVLLHDVALQELA